MSTTLTQAQQEAVERIASFVRSKPGGIETAKKVLAASGYADPVDWMEANYYVIDPMTDRAGLIHLQDFQKAIVRYSLNPANDIRTSIYSAVKKSGKSALSGAKGRYLAENSGNRAEVYYVANDKEQARGRGYQNVLSSLELNPNYNKAKNELPGKWKVIQLHAIHLPTNSTIKAIANDYAGEAGGNPVASVWTEIWGLKSEASKRLWTEMTPVLTRARSMRIVETYAGYQDESEILWDLYKLGKKGRRLTREELNWPFEDNPPVWHNEDAQLFMYWDDGAAARRMPWQIGTRAEKYYKQEAVTLTATEYERLHLNLWQVTTNPFIPDQWWQRQITQVPPLDSGTPVVMTLDASVSSDSTGMTLVSRHPDKVNHPKECMVRYSKEWIPIDTRGHGSGIDYKEVKAHIVELCSRYNVVQLNYDEYQLAQMAQELTESGIVWCKKFSQGALREIADKKLYDLIRDRKIWHDGDSTLATHMRNAAAKAVMLENDKQEKIRIVKKSKDAKVDLCVCLSMGCYETMRLLLD